MAGRCDREEEHLVVFIISAFSSLDWFWCCNHVSFAVAFLFSFSSPFLFLAVVSCAALLVFHFLLAAILVFRCRAMASQNSSRAFFLLLVLCH